MTDVFSKQKRSEVMSRIRGKDTKPEKLIRSSLHKAGFRYRLYVKDLPGKPDLVFPKYNAVIFIHGCFWHGHNCHLFKWPKTRPEFWKGKINKNRSNDRKAEASLTQSNWRVLIIWECAIKGKESLEKGKIIKQCSQWILSRKRFKEIKGRKVGAR